MNCSSDLKMFENSRPSASNLKSFSRSLEHFFLAVGQNNLGNKIPFLPLYNLRETAFFHPRIKSLNLTIFRKIMRKKPPNLQIDSGEAMLLVKVGNDGFKSRVRTLMPGPIQFRDQLNFV